MIRAYIREIPGLSAAKQRELAIVFGLKDSDRAPIYTEGRNTFPRERRYCIESFRRPLEELAVASVAVLATNRPDLADVMKELTDRHVVIVETTTGRRSNSSADLTGMLLDAVNYWSRRNRNYADPRAAAAAGAKGGRALARRRRKMRLPKNVALPIWQDRALSNEEALAKINSDPAYAIEWSESTAYRLLGPRGAFAGRRGKSGRSA